MDYEKIHETFNIFSFLKERKVFEKTNNREMLPFYNEAYVSKTKN